MIAKYFNDLEIFKGKTKLFMQQETFPKVQGIFDQKMKIKHDMATKIQKAWRIHNLFNIVRTMYVKKMKIKYKVHIFRKKIRTRKVL